MKERPILFSTPMVQALLDGRKTMTRRIIKYKKKIENPIVGFSCFTGDKKFSVRGKHEDGNYGESFFNLPYSKGDRLWVRETWNYAGDTNKYFYKAGHNDQLKGYENIPDVDNYKFRPSIFMPRKASRILLEITSIKTHHLHDITSEDAKKEGVEMIYGKCGEYNGFKNYMHDKINKTIGFGSPVNSFKSLWQSINGLASWDANPYVWAIEFKIITPCQP